MPDKSLMEITDRFFGPVAEEFFGAVGRVVVMAALVDDMLLRLVWSLTNETQETHAGKGGTELEKICRSAACQMADPLRADMLAVVGDVAETRTHRNAVVHSLWPNASVDSAFGWRAVMAHKNEGQVTKIYYTNLEGLATLVTELASQADRIQALLPWTETAKAQGQPQ